jgi:hypothetical protein
MQTYLLLADLSTYIKFQQRSKEGDVHMFKRILLAILICSLAVSGLAGFLSINNIQSIDSEGGTVLAARFDFTQVAILADPDCPTPTSGTGGGC